MQRFEENFFFAAFARAYSTRALWTLARVGSALKNKKFSQTLHWASTWFNWCIM